MRTLSTKSTRLPVPTHLAHKPLCSIPYATHDGKSKDDSDAIYLSLGRAQWYSGDLSLKVLRHTGARWSRQSEELPVHRAVDLVAFAAIAMSSRPTELPPGTLENQEDTVAITWPEGSSPAILNGDFADDIRATKDRLSKLRVLLNDLHSRGDI